MVEAIRPPLAQARSLNDALGGFTVPGPALGDHRNSARVMR
jgi:hypothetical protein